MVSPFSQQDYTLLDLWCSPSEKRISLLAVSYTHLDVYKRQVLPGMADACLILADATEATAVAVTVGMEAPGARS